MPYNPPYLKIDVRKHQELPTIFSRLFRPKTLRKIASGDTSEIGYYLEVLSQSSEQHITSLREAFEFAYHIMFWNYRSEYVYKNAFFNKRVISKNTKLTRPFLTEVRISHHTVDALIADFPGVPIEIKSPLDSRHRINGQVTAFSKVFPDLYIFTDLRLVDGILPLIPGHVGVIVLSNRYQLNVVRESETDFSRIDNSVMFDTLRSSEYVRATQAEEILDTPNTRRYDHAKSIFNKLEKTEAFRRFMEIIGDRTPEIKTSSLKTLPHSLRFAIYNAGINESDLIDLASSLN